MAAAPAGLSPDGKDGMNRHRLVACPISWLVLAFLAWAPVARAMILVPATATTRVSADGLHVKAHRVARHRAHHHDGAIVRSGRHRAFPGVPAPHSPARQRAEHRAALPVAARGHHRAPTSRPSHALPVAIVIPTGSAIAARLDALPDDSFSILAGRVISGRGPPRARRFASLPPTSLPGSLLTSRSAAPPARSSFPTHPAVAVARVLPCLPAGPRAVPLPECPETVSGRSHVRRPGGTAACLTTPSRGEAT